MTSSLKTPITQKIASGLIAPSPPDAPYGIYLHIPFCGRICPYCDFNRYVHQEHLVPAYVDALIGEIALTRAEIGPLRAETIYFGGGTPSLLEPEQVARIIDELRQSFEIQPDAEVTLEANPERLDEPSWLDSVPPGSTASAWVCRRCKHTACAFWVERISPRCRSRRYVWRARPASTI